MAIDRSTRYPGRFDSPTTARPQGAFKNRTAPGAKDGSYLERDWANDWDGFFGSLMRSAGLTPSGTPDSALSSQYFDALSSKIATAVSPKITGENCKIAGFTAGGTIPYMQREDAATFLLAVRENTVMTGSTSAPDSAAGSSSERVANTRFVTQAIATSVANNPPIGVGQSWQDMTASREKNVTYTNNTGRPIQIFIHFDPDGSLSVFTLGGHPVDVGDNASEFISAIIPNGSTYKLSAWGVAAKTKWLELR